MLTPALQCRNLGFIFVTFSLLVHCLRLNSAPHTTDGLPSIGVIYCTAYVIAFGGLDTPGRQTNCDLSITDEPTTQKQQQSCTTLGEPDARRRMRGLHNNAESGTEINLYSVLSIGTATNWPQIDNGAGRIVSLRLRHLSLTYHVAV